AGKGVRISIIRNKKENRDFLAIELGAFPTLRLRGSVPDPAGVFSLEAADFLSPNLNGWNEFTRELVGEGSFRNDASAGVLVIQGETEFLDISAGRIRRNDTRLTGAEALTALRNRQARVDALKGWMDAYLAGKDSGRAFQNQDAFEKYWRSILFPEMVSSRKRPPEWAAAGQGSEGEVWQTGEDVRWNRNYTALAFPEELRELRNSGTMLRDWEESLSWIYYQFEWDSIIESLSYDIRVSLK
ncbi:MAG: hypothetical protein LBT16_04675, partial [Treponema sp.]|nr:hypothetical protein [Treponema sp.]